MGRIEGAGVMEPGYCGITNSTGHRCYITAAIQAAEVIVDSGFRLLILFEREGLIGRLRIRCWTYMLGEEDDSRPG
ncbi:hypothetical protein PAPYR_12378 [Paratrimastix pyriformis]|uniref:Uncharacterized protein n=1 Tax=Paratrimastix pyriformis TaxID=342808 RepID=A0ABQ8U208_9EUKA|nr:hypothetical protein PAPYR_12378 [Paratrimastix pyriformis]